MVSAVVNVFETTTKSVLAGSASSSARAMATGSTFAAKESVRPRAAAAQAGALRSAS